MDADFRGGEGYAAIVFFQAGFHYITFFQKSQRRSPASYQEATADADAEIATVRVF
jgi:hypothetical protein